MLCVSVYVLVGGFFTISATWEAHTDIHVCLNIRIIHTSFQCGSVEESACQGGDIGSIPGLGRCPGEGNDNLLQYACLGNPMERGV